MKLRTAIVEDQKPDAERLEQLLKKAFGEEEILCRRFVCGDDFLKEFPGEGYQVVFLDICMEGTNGIETARQQPELEVRIARQIVRLPLTKIYYATAQNHYVRVVTDDGECRATANFAQVQEQLQTQPEFLVCNRGVIINMSKVLRFEGDCIEMLDGTHLPVRQKDKNSLLAQFTQYQFRGMQREF